MAIRTLKDALADFLVFAIVNILCVVAVLVLDSLNRC